MLSGVEKSKVPLGHFGPPSMTNPNPVKAYVEKFTEEEQKPVREHVSIKLKKMIYVKHLEEMLSLYDLYSVDEEKNVEKIYEKISDSYNIKPYISFFLSSAVVSAYLFFRKKASPLQFESYLNNFYAVAGIWGFSYTYFSWSQSYSLNNKSKDVFNNKIIMSAKSQLHSEAVSLTNEIRFNPQEAI